MLGITSMLFSVNSQCPSEVGNSNPVTSLYMEGSWGSGGKEFAQNHTARKQVSTWTQAHTL